MLLTDDAYVTKVMVMAYFFILLAVLITAPFLLRLAQSQNNKLKKRLKNLFLILLSAQLILGFLNWENFSNGRSAYELSFAYPYSFVGLFFVISAVEICFLFFGKSFQTPIMVLNALNSGLIFVAMIRLSSMLGYQSVSIASVVAVFFVLIGNVVGLAYINKDPNLLKKYFGV